MTLDELITSLQEWRKLYPGTTAVRCEDTENGEWIPDGSDWLPGQPEDDHGVIMLYNYSESERILFDSHSNKEE